MAQQRPGMLTAVAIIAIVIGVLGSCVSSFTFASTLAQGPLNEFNRANLESMQGANPEMLQRQLETQDRLQEIAESWQPFTLTHQVLNLFASLALGIAGILLLRWKPMALGLFVGAADIEPDADGEAVGGIVDPAIAGDDLLVQLFRQLHGDGLEQHPRRRHVLVDRAPDHAGGGGQFADGHIGGALLRE